MKKKLLYLLMLIPSLIIAQTHSIDQHNIQMYGNTNDNDISRNTYYNTQDSCNIAWNIIKDSLPSQWNFSICFPNCYIQGLSQAQNNFITNEQVLLNCHMYPNGQSGEGTIQMEITTNNFHKDTVTWIGAISGIAAINDFNILKHKDKYLVKIINILGKEVTRNQNQPLFYLYNDGSAEKRIIRD